MRLGIGRAIVNQFHFLTGNIDQLIVLRMERANRQEAVFRELGQNNQPFAISIAGFSQRCVVVARLILHVQLLTDVIYLVTVVVLDGIGNIPLAHLAVDKQRGVGIATAVEGSVQGSETQLRLGHDGVAQFDLVFEQIVQFINGNHGYRW